MGSGVDEYWKTKKHYYIQEVYKDVVSLLRILSKVDALPEGWDGYDILAFIKRNY